MSGPKTDKIKYQETCDLLKLALNCKFITASREKEILPRALKYFKNDTEASIVRFFVERNILSEKKIELLNAIKNHLDTLMADKKFGKLGVANEFVTREQVKKALDMQVEIFRKEKKSVKIGDILVNNKDISPANKTAILKAQGRIRDDFLADHSTVIEIQEDITSDTNKADSILKVEGNIAPGIHVNCQQLILTGDILGNVTASGNIDVLGNIGMKPGVGNHSGDPVLVNTKGRLKVSRNIINAKIIALEGIKAQNSDLTSSRVFLSQDLIAKNIFSSPDAPSILRIVREEYTKIQDINTLIKKKSGMLDTLSHKSELDRLTKELLEQVQVQNGVLEKQNVLLYLNKIIDDPDLENIDDLVKKVDSYEKNNKAVSNKKDISIPENTQAYKFMKIILGKIKKKRLKNQKEYINGLYDNISAMYKKTVIITEKMNQKYEIRSKEIETEIERIKPRIEEKKMEIEKLSAQKNSLQVKQKKRSVYKNPVIKVKNQVQKHTIIQGEKAELVIDQSIYGVSIREDYTSSQAGPKMIVEGYFQS